MIGNFDIVSRYTGKCYKIDEAQKVETYLRRNARTGEQWTWRECGAGNVINLSGSKDENKPEKRKGKRKKESTPVWRKKNSRFGK